MKIVPGPLGIFVNKIQLRTITPNFCNNGTYLGHPFSANGIAIFSTTMIFFSKMILIFQNNNKKHSPIDSVYVAGQFSIIKSELLL